MYAIYSDGTIPAIVDNALLTFISSDEAVAVVDETGLVTANTVGSANIEVVATDKPTLSAYAVVTVSE